MSENCPRSNRNNQLTALALGVVDEGNFLRLAELVNAVVGPGDESPLGDQGQHGVPGPVDPHRVGAGVQELSEPRVAVANHGVEQEAEVSLEKRKKCRN